LVMVLLEGRGFRLPGAHNVALSPGMRVEVQHVAQDADGELAVACVVRVLAVPLERDEGERGVALARALALTSYRPDALIDRRFHAADPECVLEGLGRYFETQGGRFARAFEARRYLALSEALDRHCVDPAAIGCPVELIGAESDRLVPAAQLRALAGAIGLKARFHRIESAYGHDAFLKSPDRINALLQRIFATCQEAGHA